MAADGALQLVLQALATLETPTSSVEQRRDASLFLEQAKRGDAHVLLGVGGTLVTSQFPTSVKVVGYTLLTDLVRGRWAELSNADRQQVTQLAYEAAASVSSDARPLKGKAAVLMASVVRQQGAEAYSQVVPQLVARAAAGPTQAELACLVLGYLSEDVTFFDTSAGGENKRLFLAALTNSVSSVFPFLCEVLQQHFLLAMKAQQEQPDQVAAHTAVIQAALGALSTWVEWTPMARIASSSVLDACTFFMTVPDFRLPALDVLRQVAGRKRTTEPWPEYVSLMDKLALQLIGRAAEMGLMVAPGQLPPGLSAQLDFGGDLEEVGRRLVALLVALCESHVRAMASDERRLQLMQLLLVLTAHPYLVLPATTLPVWAQLLREATPGNTTSTGNNASLHGLSQQALAQVMGPGHQPGTITPLPLPPEACQALLQVAVGLLPKVVSAADVAAAVGQLETASSFDARTSPARPPSSAGNAAPAYFDTPQDWREFCLTVRGQVKVVVRAAAQLFPDQGLALTSQTLQQALAGATAAVAAAGAAGLPPQRLSQVALLLDCAVHVQEAALPPLVEHAASRPALLEGVVGLLQAAMAARYVAPRLVLLHARCLEAFGRVLVPRPDLAAPLVRTCLEVLVAIPLAAHGQEPPPRKITREWKSTAEARLSMANAVAQVAKAAPAAMAPHLRALSDQVSVMWDAGQLMEGERVLLWEGLITAAGGVSPLLAGQLLGWLLGPLAGQWSSAAWQARVATPHAFVLAYLPLEAVEGGQPGEVSLGARAERWALYHQLTLLERAMRRTAPHTPSNPANHTSADGRSQSPRPPGAPAQALAAAGTADGGQQQPAVQAEYPMDAHLSWCLPAVAAILRCVHELAAAEAANQLGPLQGIMALDDMDKTVRAMVEDPGGGAGGREAKQPRCVAGGDVLLDGRYFLRSLREASSMIISLAALHASPAALWARADLAAAITQAATLHLQALDNNHMRLLTRHVVAQMCARCPPAHQRVWLLPLLSAYLPHMAQRLSEGWAGQTASSTGGAPSRTAVSGSAGSTSGAPLSPGPHHGRSRQEVDEVVGDMLLREVTREYMHLLLNTTLRPGEKPGSPQPGPGGAAGGGRKRESSSSGAVGVADGAGETAGRGPGAAAGVAAGGGGGMHASGSTTSMTDVQAGLEADGAQAAGARNTVFDLLVAERPDLAQLVVHTAISGMCWPDAESVTKAILVCRFLVSWGLREGGDVQDAVVGPLLQAAIYSLAQVYNALMQPDLLALLRALLVGALTQPHTAQRVRATLTSLLQVPPQVLADFEAQLAAKGSEKEQRNIIKGLVAQAGGEEVRKVLAAMSKLPANTGLSVASGRSPAPPRKDPAQVEQDSALQGAIYNAIFG